MRPDAYKLNNGKWRIGDADEMADGPRPLVTIEFHNPPIREALADDILEAISQVLREREQSHESTER